MFSGINISTKIESTPKLLGHPKQFYWFLLYKIFGDIYWTFIIHHEITFHNSSSNKLRHIVKSISNTLHNITFRLYILYEQIIPF